jgi:hypothetical protein
VIDHNQPHVNGTNDYAIAGGNDPGPNGSAATSTSPRANLSH